MRLIAENIFVPGVSDAFQSKDLECPMPRYNLLFYNPKCCFPQPCVLATQNAKNKQMYSFWGIQWLAGGTFLYLLNQIEVQTWNHRGDPSYFDVRGLAGRCREGNAAPVGIRHLIVVFCLPGSFILREGEEHVTRRDQDPARASRTLLHQIAGRHVPTCLFDLFAIATSLDA